MKNNLMVTIALVLLFATSANSQNRRAEPAPSSVVIRIIKAEDSCNFEAVRSLIESRNLAIQKRASLAAGRIGDERALTPLSVRLKSSDTDVRAMAAFAIGEIESIKGADAILDALRDPATPDVVRARAVEAAGKIAAANSKDQKTKELTRAIVGLLESESQKAPTQNRDIVLLAITAVLRTKPENGDVVTAKYLTSSDARIRADAANTLSRLHAKNGNAALRSMLKSDSDPTARANAARALGSAEDADAYDLLLDAATSDEDLRVRVSAIRSLASLKDSRAAEPLLARAKRLFGVYSFNSPGARKHANPAEKNELLEIVTALGRLLSNTSHKTAYRFLQNFALADAHHSPEIETALARIAPVEYSAVGFSAMTIDKGTGAITADWRAAVSNRTALAELAFLDPNGELKLIRSVAENRLREYLRDPFKDTKGAVPSSVMPAIPDTLRSFAAFKPADLNAVLLRELKDTDVFIRAAAAELLADQPASKENIDALKTAFDSALLKDKYYDDAQLAILDALFKADKKESFGSLLIAVNAADYLVRKKAFDLLADKELEKGFPGITTSLAAARRRHKDQVLPYAAGRATKLGQILNIESDYRRAASRKNGMVKAMLTTDKGMFTIELWPEDAPLTVDNFIKLARSNYFNGLEFHRVVPNFVIQGGDPRGDGNGGPGWSIRCEINMLPFDRGAVGMALSGKDTGGSQWFVTHSPQPHLDGGYTVFGRVSESDMKVVDTIVRGDKILSVRIVETNLTPRSRGKN
ncbi:MAG: peptidylprolyl isomerase [Pyrinomonadaceae bacterium]